MYGVYVRVCWMCVCMHAYVCGYVCVYSVCMYMYAFVYIGICIYVCMCLWVSVCMCVQVGMCIYTVCVCVYACVYRDMHICVCVYDVCMYICTQCVYMYMCAVYVCVCLCSFKIGSIKWSTSPGLSSCGIPTATLMASLCQECLRALGSEAPWFSFPLLLVWGFVLFQFAAFSELSRSTEPPFIITLHFVIYTKKPLGVSSCIFTFIMPAV